MANSYKNPDIIIETDKLNKILNETNLRIIDCNVDLGYADEGGYIIKSGKDGYLKSHIPNSIFLDLSHDLTDKKSHLSFMLPTEKEFSYYISEAGINNNHDIILYSKGANYWATRLFLMLKAFGFKKCRVLNGGWDKWIKENREVTDIIPFFKKETCQVKLNPGEIIGKDDVLQLMNKERVCLMNALSSDLHSGKTFKENYGRPGHITGSKNLFAQELINKEDMTFLNARELENKFRDIGVFDSDQTIAYCGGGISATTNVFCLLLLGYENVSLYDGSLTEWGPEKNLPMSTL